MNPTHTRLQKSGVHVETNQAKKTSAEARSPLGLGATSMVQMIQMRQDTGLTGENVMAFSGVSGQQIMRKALGSYLPGHPEAAMAGATSGGGGEVPYRKEMETAFGVDFGGVRAYTGKATEMAALNARAAAQGESVAFAESSPSRSLVAHELTHVVQSRQHGRMGPQRSTTTSRPGDPAEVQAEQVAAAFERGDIAPARAVNTYAARSNRARIMRDSLRRVTNENWNTAKACVADKWERIEAQQLQANNDWARNAAITDPPSIEEQILIGTLTAGITVVTGGIGGAIAAHVTRGITAMATQAIRRAAVEAGKQVVSRSANAAVGALRSPSGGSGDAADRYKRSADSTVGDVVDTEKTSTRTQLDALDDNENKWDIAQNLYDALEASRHEANIQQYNAMVDGWFSQLAQARVGTNMEPGPGNPFDFYDERPAWIRDTDETAIPGFQTSQVGVLGLHLGPPRGHPGENPTILYAELEGSPGNNARIRNSLLNRRLSTIRMPKTLVAEGRLTPGYAGWAEFSIGLDEDNDWNSGSVHSRGTNPFSANNGQVWLAQKALFKFEELTQEEVRLNWRRGARSVVNHILGMTLSRSNIREIDT